MMRNSLLENLTVLERAIVSTIIYFDIFDYPLTLIEIWKWLYIENQNSNFKFKIVDIQNILKNSENLKNVIEKKNGLYFLKGKKELIKLRQKRHKLIQRRWKKLRRLTILLQLIPNVKMIAACNNMAINSIKPESDIDVFIIVKKDRIWQTRFLITLLIAALGQWRHRRKIANKICLSFYLTDDNLNLSWLTKKPYDIYMIYWLALVFPLLDRGVYNSFILENKWARRYLPNFIKYDPVLFERKVSEIFALDVIRKLLETILEKKLGDFVEFWFKKIQMAKMRKRSTRWEKNGTDVVISDQILKFHENDRRLEFREKFENKLENVDNLWI